MPGPRIVHNVYFTLKDASPQAKEKMLTTCRTYLTGHAGEISFAVGTLAEELNRPVNDRDWHIALHIVFQDQPAHDQYQADPRHNQFIEENKANWKQVRVFDSAVEM